MTAEQAALEYLRRGWLSIPLEFKRKEIHENGWQSWRLDTPEKIRQRFNGKSQNLGVLTGKPSGGLIDIDIDLVEALPLANAFLPATRSFGRKSKPSSHRLYRVANPPATKKFQYQHGRMIVEFRSTGGQTVFPPSVHPSGEPIEWDNEFDPLEMTAGELMRKVSIVAAGSALSRAWPKVPGIRDEVAMALAGGLLRAHWTVKDAEQFILAVSKAAYDEESIARSQKARHTEQKLKNDEPVTGWKRLQELLDKETVEKAREWLGIKEEFDDDVHQDSTFHLTDLGNSERMVAQHGQDIRYCHDWAKWLCWNGTHWELDATAEVVRRARETVRSIYAEAAKAESKETRRAIAEHARRCEAEGKIKAMLSLAESEAGVPIRPRELDQHPMLLNCLNGTLDLTSGALRPHDPKDFITRVIPIEFDPDSLCPAFDRFLSEILADNAELIDFIQKAVGYSLTGVTTEQVIFLLWGTGFNGKSTLLEILRSLLGDYARQIQSESLMIRRFDNGQSNDIASLKGARLVTSVETEDGRRLAEAKIKALSGGDTVMARHLYSEFFEFRPEFKLWLACNHKPVIRGTDLAIWRRIRLVPFTVTIPEPRQDKELFVKLKAELPGLLAWAVRGCLTWQKYGLGQPEEVRNATAAYRSEMDTLALFLSECCTQRPNLETSAKGLYERFRRWVEETGERGMSQIMFGRKLGEHGFDSRPTRSGNAWIGLGLLNETDE